MEAAIAATSHGLHGPGVRPRVGSLLFPGFGTGLLNFSLIPLMTTCLGNKDSPLCAPVSPGGHPGCWGDTRCSSWQVQAGHLHDPETQGTAPGPPWGDAGDKGPL